MTDAPEPGATYARSGVDIEAGREAVDRIRDLVRSTYRPEVAGDLGGFGGLFALDTSRWRNPVLVSGTDGVGTKVMIAEQTGVHDTIGIDLVAMSVNDVAVQGAEPLFFLDYIVTGKVEPAVIESLVSGVAEGCRRAGCALIGGEIAEHPGHMAPGSFDLAGFCVGAVERDRLVTGAAIQDGDILVALASSGLHANGYSLVRKVLLDDAGLAFSDVPEGLGCTLGEELLRPTTIYPRALLDIRAAAEVRGLAHITGGGIPENLARVIPEGLQGVVYRGAWPVPPIFGLIASTGGVAELEMFNTFNMGVGMVVAVPADDAGAVIDVADAAGLGAHAIGEVVSHPGPGRVRIE